GFVFSKTKYWDQLPSLSSESKREDATARFLRRGFPYGFSSGIPCSAYTRKYPIPGTRRGPYTVGQQCVKNTVENIVRIKPVNIVNRYIIHQRVPRRLRSPLMRSQCRLHRLVSLPPPSRQMG